MDGIVAFSGLFGIAFVAATILPAQSEAALVGLQLAGYRVVLLVLVASIGNTLGAVLNWALARRAERYPGSRWFPVSPAALDKASTWYRKWGRWSLLLSWAPIDGDARLYQFTYGWTCPVSPPVLDRFGLRAEKDVTIFANVPPASVYKLTRRGDVDR